MRHLARRADCRDCPIKANCTDQPVRAPNRSRHEPARQRAEERTGTPARRPAHRISMRLRLRLRDVAPPRLLSGRHDGPTRLRLRGLRAAEQFPLAATARNLRRMPRGLPARPSAHLRSGRGARAALRSDGEARRPSIPAASTQPRDVLTAPTAPAAMPSPSIGRLLQQSQVISATPPAEF